MMGIAVLNPSYGLRPITADGMRTADLADALVVNKASITAQRWGERYDGTYTFDQAALALAGTKHP